eukprot:15461331-Alexandrium_andersonii.AAC.2
MVLATCGEASSAEPALLAADGLAASQLAAPAVGASVIASGHPSGGLCCFVALSLVNPVRESDRYFVDPISVGRSWASGEHARGVVLPV